MSTSLLTNSGSIANCDSDPIHLSASIQNRGVLIGFSWPDQRVQFASDNCEKYLNKPLKELLGSRLDHTFPHEVTDAIADLARLSPWRSRGHHLSKRPLINERIFDAYLFETEGMLVMELEEYKNDSEISRSSIEGEQALRDYLLEVKGVRSVTELSRITCATVRRIAGLDRVMVLKFHPPTWYGEVIAEDRITKAHSYLGQRFPATDVPKPARDLYLKNPVRLISKIENGTASIHPRNNPKTKKTVDLSLSRLRSVPDVHVEYLKNMGVTTSFSLGISSGDTLWGLITCHHLSPIEISQSTRTLCEVVSNIFSVQAPLLEESIDQKLRLSFEIKLRKILDSLRLSSDPLDLFFRQHRTVTEAFMADGIALVSDSLNDFAGLTPLKADVENLAHWLRGEMAQENKNAIAIDNLGEKAPDFAHIKNYASGVLAAKIPDAKDSLLILFRPEISKTITWGGNPRKGSEEPAKNGGISPRKSFQAWTENMSNQSNPWTKFEIEGLVFIRDFVFDGLIKKMR